MPLNRGGVNSASRTLCVTAVRVAACLLAAPAGLMAAESSPGVDFFEKRIRPVLVKHCYSCHSRGAKTLQGGLRLDSRQGMLAGGDSGPSVLPGKVEQSPLISAIRYDGLEMPPKGKLPPAVVADFVKWVKMGASDPRTGAASPVRREIDLEKGREFWAFQPPRRHAPPAVTAAAWPRNGIDRFILARLEEHGLTPVADADRRRLIRRVTFDLTGLPPTPNETVAFLGDESPLAFERIVDRLLASPHFGEHWGRHWLDLARYADSNGGDINLTFPNAWRYRDYVVDAFNADKPFDRFAVEQLAGDLPPHENDADRAAGMIATGFLIVGPKMLSERDKEKLRMDVVDEQLDSIGRTFLGLTLGCARCHDHKFDPIPTRDYYALAGILRNTTTVQGIRMNNVNVSGWIERPLPIKTEHQQALARHQQQTGALSKRIAALKAELDGSKKGTRVAAGDLPCVVVDDEQAKKVGVWKKSTFVPRYVGAGYVHDDKQDKGRKSITFTPRLPQAGEYEVRISYASGNGRAANTPVTIRHAEGESKVLVNQGPTPPIDSLFRSLGRFRFEAGEAGSVTISTEGTKEHVIADAAQFIPIERLKHSPRKPKDNKDQTAARLAGKTRQLKELEAQLAALRKTAPPPAPRAMAAAEVDQIADCHIRIRGEPHNQGEMAPRGFLSVTGRQHWPAISPAQSGRLELARWIASEHNPLTARVIVNRMWHHLFGAGLVASVDNFGKQGRQPSHPKLLDHLAVQFLEDGWSVKKTVRRIVLSRVYQLDVRGDERSAAADPGNRLLWRHNRHRLSAESIRDALLAVSGELDRRPGGSSVSGLGEQAIANNLRDKTGKLALANVRRSLYLPLVRNDLPDVLTVFDFADPDVVVGARAVTTVPAQALFMLNSDFVKRRARQLARLAIAANPRDADARLDYIYRRTLNRPPDVEEASRARQFMAEKSSANDEQAWTNFCHALLASTEFRYVE